MHKSCCIIYNQHRHDVNSVSYGDLLSSPIISPIMILPVGSRRLTCLINQVEPQEKRKTPKGRAKKRITYTRRFVNVTMTGGKRKVCSHQLALPRSRYFV